MTCGQSGAMQVYLQNLHEECLKKRLYKSCSASFSCDCCILCAGLAMHGLCSRFCSRHRTNLASARFVLAVMQLGPRWRLFVHPTPPHWNATYQKDSCVSWRHGSPLPGCIQGLVFSFSGLNILLAKYVVASYVAICSLTLLHHVHSRTWSVSFVGPKHTVIWRHTKAKV